jgi:ribosomal-protein-alanine N-acetyltransferase
VPGVERLEALVVAGNNPSCRVLDEADFRREGLLREYLPIGTTREDVWLYSLIRRDLALSQNPDNSI